ncbi:MAG: glycosyltransferase family 2 protein [Oligoflexia bacterium]|nr:glycosyltransferase family 2 protein [Oligoflexia bacterium]
MKKIAAIVVTFNRLTTLRVVISKLQNQTFPLSEIIIVNNGSTDGTQEWLSSKKEQLTIINQQNTGGSGGFYSGIKYALESSQNHNYVWLMDDDGHPDDSALEELIPHLKTKSTVLNSLVLDILKTGDLVFSAFSFKHQSELKNAPTIQGMLFPFNGTLIPLSLVKRIGLPIPEMFIWGDESEYYFRMKNVIGNDMYIIPSSIFYHPKNNGRFYQKNWSLLKDWQVYFFVRNKQIVYLTKYRNNKFMAVFHYLVFILALLAYTVCFSRSNFLKKLILYKTAISHSFEKQLAWKATDVKKYINNLLLS